jgi:hypothetical protein
MWHCHFSKQQGCCECNYAAAWMLLLVQFGCLEEIYMSMRRQPKSAASRCRKDPLCPLSRLVAAIVRLHWFTMIQWCLDT